MRKGWARIAFAVALVGTCGATLSTASAQQASDVRVDIKLKDADMLTATRTLTQQTGIMFVVEPTNEPFARISLNVKDVTAEDAIKYICQAAGASYRRDDNGVYIIGRFKAVEVAPTVETKAPLVRVVRKLRVLKASARDVHDQIIYNVPYNSFRGFEELKRFGNLHKSDTDRIFSSAINVNAGGTSNYFSPVPAGQASSTLSNAETGNNITLPGDAANQIGGGRIGGGGGGIGGAGGQGGIGGGGGGIGGAGGQGGIGGQGGGQAQLVGGQGLVPQSIDFVSYDPTDNSLIVRGTEEDIQQLQTYVNLLDVAPKQVLIKVEFITTTDNINRSLGTEFLYQRGTVFAGTRPGSFVRTGDPVFLNYATGNITARLRASLTEGNARVVAAPIVRTLNNQPASVSSFITTFIFITQTQAVQGAGVINTVQPLPLTAGTFLSVSPRINDDGTITVFLSPSIGGFSGTSRSPDGSELPNQFQQTISVVARVRNGETIVLGGLTDKNEDNTISRVPVLSELPIIGQFFRFTRRQKTQSELLIFVTPTVVDEDTTGNPGGP